MYACPHWEQLKKDAGDLYVDTDTTEYAFSLRCNIQ